NLCVAGFGVLIEKGFRRQDDAVDAEATLHCLFVDERLLDRVRFLNRAKSLERGDLRPGHRSDRRDTRSNCLSFHDYRAGAALSEAATKLRSSQFEIIAEHVQERRCRIGIDGVGAPVYLQIQHAHENSSIASTTPAASNNRT